MSKELVEAVFDHWVTTTKTGRGPKPVLTDKRRRLIKKALADYGYDTVCAAITGVTLSDWHMGHNPRGKKYTSIELILRDAEHIEQFAENVYDADETTSDPFQGFFE